MYVRRLIFLFVCIVGAVTLMAARLFHLQVTQVETWRRHVAVFSNRHYIIEPTRGSILDAKGRPLALDVPCYDLAIDYRAMIGDEKWITQLAIVRMKDAGITDRAQRVQKLPQ